MRFIYLSLLCLLFAVSVTGNAEEGMEMSTEVVSCEQEASDLGLEPGEEFDNYVADCEKAEAMQTEEDSFTVSEE